MEKKNNKEYITNEMINKYLKKHIYHDKNGIIHTTDNKYELNNN